MYKPNIIDVDATTTVSMTLYHALATLAITNEMSKGKILSLAQYGISIVQDKCLDLLLEKLLFILDHEAI